MAKRIKSIVEQVSFYLGKAQSGYNSPDIITRELNTESLNKFKDLISEYAKTRQISEYLQPFLNDEPAQTVPAGGKISKPNGYEHGVVVSLEDGTEVVILETKPFIHRKKHPNKAPTTTYPICRMYGSTIEIAPADPGQKVIVSYFKPPTSVVYAFTQSGENYNYDDDNSVDWEWSQLMTDDIVLRVLSNFGINLKDGQLIEYGELQEAKE